MTLKKPKWKSKKLVKRLNWIEQADLNDDNDCKILKELTDNDESSIVRNAARLKRGNKNAVTTPKKNIKTKVVSNTKQMKLAETAINDEDYYVRKTAIERLEDEELLLEVVRNSSDDLITSTAIQKITSQEILISLALSKNGNASVSAIYRLESSAVLLDLLSSRKQKIRTAAAFRLSNLATNAPEHLLDDWDKIKSAFDELQHTENFGQMQHEDLGLKFPFPEVPPEL